MELPHTDPIDSEDTTGRAGAESLAAYVQRMETEGNLRKLAAKFKDDLTTPGEGEHPAFGASAPDAMPDFSFEKFEEKRKRRGDQ